MANVAFTPGLISISIGQINLTADDIRAVLIDTGAYTLNQSHQFLSSIPSGARVATVQLTGKTVNADAAFDANNVTLPGFTGPTVEAIALYKYDALDTAARLFWWIDTGAGLPLTPDGRPVEIRWSDAIQKIMRFRSP